MNLDIVSVSDFQRSAEVFKLVKMLASRIGSKIDVSKLANLMNISRKSVDDYLVLLEQTYLIRTIAVTSNNFDREIVKARKLYFLDNGIANMLADLGSGAKFENAVFNQLHHHGEVTYYQLKTGKEIDFILDKKMAFEAKETPEQHDLKNLRNTAKNLGIEQCFLIGRHSTPFRESTIWGGEVW